MRRPPNKTESLISALLFTAATLLWAFLGIKASFNLEQYSKLTMGSVGAILVIGSILSGIHWHRWFTFDKKK